MGVFKDIEPYIILKKEKVHSERYVRNVPSNILILQMVDDNSMSNVITHLKDLFDDYMDHGFEEVWLADYYFDIEVYGDIELYCLYPKSLYGYYQQPWPDRKPYG
jgi:hypothetical protein